MCHRRTTFVFGADYLHVCQLTDNSLCAQTRHAGPTSERKRIYHAQRSLVQPSADGRLRRLQARPQRIRLHRAKFSEQFRFVHRQVAQRHGRHDYLPGSGFEGIGRPAPARPDDNDLIPSDNT